jgi:hypothetical protein
MKLHSNQILFYFGIHITLKYRVIISRVSQGISRQGGYLSKFSNFGGGGEGVNSSDLIDNF